MLKKISISIIAFIILLVGFINFMPETVYHSAMFFEGKLASLNKKKIKINNQEIYYLEGGQGETLLLIHGFNGDKYNWIRMAKFLTPKYKVIIPDLPGFAESSKNLKGNYSITAQAQFLKLFMKKLNINKFHIAGNSMGGAISATFSYLYPKLVKTLALFDSAGVKSENKSEFTKLLSKGKNPLIVNKPEDYFKMIDFAFKNPPYVPDSIQLYLGRKNLQNTPINKIIFSQIEKDIFNKKNLNKIKTKTFIFWGKQDRILDVSSVKIFKKEIKNSTIFILDDCGHVPMLEQPKKTAKAYIDFLKN